MPYTDDPIADFNRHDAEQSRWLEKLPVCSNCDKHIQDEHYYVICDENICPECLEKYFKVTNEEY